MNKPSLPEPSRGETAAEWIAHVASIAPWLGGPVSGIIQGQVSKRRAARTKTFIEDLAQDVGELRAEVRQDYVRTEDFEELLVETTERVMREAQESQRKLYGRFLRGQIAAPDLPLSNQLEVLDQLSRLKPEHVVVLEAIAREPTPHESDARFGSPGFTIQRRSGLPQDVVEVVVQELDGMLITSGLHRRLRTTMRGIGATSLSGSVTQRGWKLLRSLAPA